LPSVIWLDFLKINYASLLKHQWFEIKCYFASALNSVCQRLSKATAVTLAFPNLTDSLV